MIAACPKCSARYRIEKGKLGPEGARLRCSRCEAVFRVRPPEPEVQPPPVVTPEPEVQPSPVVTREPAAAEPVQVAAPTSPVPAATSEEAPDRSRLVLVADPVIEEGKATASALAAWGLQPILVHDGVEAMLTIQRTLPCAAIIDAALPKMYGFQVCEVLKRNDSLRSIHVVLVGAIHDRTRYRRTPTELYGADAYLERPQLPDALWPILHEFGIPLAGAAPPPEAPQELPYPMSGASLENHAPRAPEPPMASEPPMAPAPPPVPEAPPPVASVSEPLEPVEPVEPVAEVAPSPPVAETPATPPSVESAAAPGAVSDTVSEAEIAKAERLARIVVSDIILYNQEKFDAAIVDGDVLGALDTQLAEGRTLFAQRIEAHVRDLRDFLGDELVRVAGLRRRQ